MKILLLTLACLPFTDCHCSNGPYGQSGKLDLNSIAILADVYIHLPDNRTRAENRPIVPPKSETSLSRKFVASLVILLAIGWIRTLDNES